MKLNLRYSQFSSRRCLATHLMAKATFGYIKPHPKDEKANNSLSLSISYTHYL